MKALLFQKLPLGLTVSSHLRCPTRGLCKPLNVKLTFCVHELHLPLLIPVLPHTVAPSSQVVAVCGNLIGTPLDFRKDLGHVAMQLAYLRGIRL